MIASRAAAVADSLTRVAGSLRDEVARQHALLEVAATRAVHVTFTQPQTWSDSALSSALVGALGVFVGGLIAW